MNRMKKSMDGQAGFSLIEMMVAMAVMLIVAGIVMQAMMQMLKVQGSMANRSEMHSSIRSATELMQQEIGQAGKVSLPTPAAPLTLATAVTVPTGLDSITVPVSVSAATTGMFNGEYLVVDVGNDMTLPGTPDKQETVQISGLTGSGFTATFTKSHLSGAPILLQGAFGTGIVPPDQPTLAAMGVVLPASFPAPLAAGVGSSGNVLKLYGDLNGDGNMLYAEYVCDTAGANGTGNLYRNTMPYDLAPGAKTARNSSMIILNNLSRNPANAAGVVTPCFTYTVSPTNNVVFVVNVGITLTAQSVLQDPQTHQFQTESKALLNVSPRNVYQAWMLSGAGLNYRVQPMPPSIYDPLTGLGLLTTTP